MNKKSARKTSVKSKGTKKDGLNHGMVFGHTAANVYPVIGIRNRSTQTPKVLIKAFENAMTNNVSLKLKQTDTKFKTKSRMTHKIKFGQAIKSHVKPKTTAKLKDKFVSRETSLRHSRVAEKIKYSLNNEDSSTESLQFHGIDVPRDKVGTTKLRKSNYKKTKSHHIRYVTHKNNVKKISKKPRHIKSATESQTPNLQTPKSGFKKSNTRLSSPKTMPLVGSNSKKSDLYGNTFLDHSVVDIERDLGELDKSGQNEKSISKGRNYHKRNESLGQTLKKRKASIKLSSKQVFSCVKSAAVDKSPYSTNVMNITEEMDTNSNNLERSPLKKKYVRIPQQLLRKKRKASKLTRNGTKSSLHSRKSWKNTVTPSQAQRKKKKRVIDTKKSTSVSIPVIGHNRSHNEASNSPPSKRPRISPTPLLVSKPSSTRKQKIPSHLMKRIPQKSLTGLKENVASESQLYRRSTRLLPPGKQNSSLVTIRITPKRSVAKKSVLQKSVPRSVLVTKRAPASLTKKEVNKLQLQNKSEGSPLLHNISSKKLTSLIILSPEKRNITLISPVNMDNLLTSKNDFKSKSFKTSQRVNTRKSLRFISAKAAKSISTMTHAISQINAGKLSSSKRLRVSNNASLKKDLNRSTVKNFHFTKEATKHFANNKINKKRLLTSKSPLQRVSKRLLRSKKQSSLLPTVVTRKAPVAKKLQKPIVQSSKSVKNLPGRKQDKSPLIKKRQNKLSLSRKNVSSESSVSRPSLETKSSIQETKPVIFINDVCSSSAKKGVNKLSAFTKQKISVASVLLKKDSQKRKHKSGYNSLKVTPKQIITRSKSKSTSNKILYKSLQPENNVLSCASRMTTKRSVSKKSVIIPSQKSILTGKKIKQSLLKKDKKLSVSRQQDSTSWYSPNTKDILSHLVVSKLKSVVNKPFAKVTAPELVVTKRVCSSHGRKKMHTVSTIKKQKKLAISSTKKKIPKPSIKATKVKISAITNKVTKLSLNDMTEHFGQKKSTGSLLEDKSKKSFSLVSKRSPKESFKRKLIFMPKRKKEALPSKIIIKNNSPNKVQKGKHVPAATIKTTSNRNTICKENTPRKKLTVKSLKMFTNKKSPMLSENVQDKQLLTEITTRKHRAAKKKKPVTVFKNKKILVKSSHSRRQSQSATSLATDISKLRKKTTKRIPNTIFSENKHLKLLTTIEGRKSLSLTPRWTKLKNASEFEKIELVSFTKPLLAKKQILETIFLATPKNTGRKYSTSDKSKGIESPEEVNVSFHKTGKLSSCNSLFEINQPSWQIITSATPLHLTTKSSNLEREFPSTVHRSAETFSRNFDTVYARQPGFTISNSLKSIEVSPAKTVCIEIDKKNVSSSEVRDAKPLTEEKTDSSCTRQVKFSPRLSQIANTSYGRKDSSFAETTTDSLPAYTMDKKSTQQKKNMLTSDVAAHSSSFLSDDYARDILHTTALFQIKSTASSTPQDYTRYHGQEITEISDKQPAHIDMQHVITDTGCSKLSRRSYIASNFDSENLSTAAQDTNRKFEVNAENDKQSYVIEEGNESEDLEKNIYKKEDDRYDSNKTNEDMNLREELRYDRDTTISHSPHSQRCTVS